MCDVCGGRLSIQRSKGTHKYFYCLGQKDRRKGTGRQERYIAADHLKAKVDDLYGHIEAPNCAPSRRTKAYSTRAWRTGRM